jgi:hypothetical protein
MNKARLQKHLRHFIIISVALLCLSACTKHQKLPNALDTYHERVYGVLGIPMEDLKFKVNIEAPSKNTWALEIPSLQINMREFYALEGCEIKSIVAERNTALGKMQLPSTRLQYEWRLISALRLCQEQLSVAFWLEQKQASYALNWANMITQSQEIYSSLVYSGGFIDGSADDNFTQAKLDLQQLLNSLHSPDTALVNLESSLQSMQGHSLYARHTRSQLLLTQSLKSMTEDISQWASTFQCNTRRNREDLTILRNVFNLYFVQEIQAIASQINHYHYQLKPIFLDLVGVPQVHPDFSQWLESHQTSTFKNYQAAMREHIVMWQSIFVMCD